MAIINPVYALIVPFLFVFTIPLAVFAGITTTLAFSVLMFRVAVVYVDIAVNMVPQYLTGRRVYPFPRGYASTLLSTTEASSNVPPSPVGSGTNSPPTSRQIVRHHRRRRTSGASLQSVGSITPVDDHPNGALGSSAGVSKRNSFMMMAPSIGIDRDFEGVGGWRLGGRNPDDDDDAWTHINSRLELPLDHQRKHHQRSPSGGGATTPGGGSGGDFLVMKSPNSARSRERSPDNGGKRGGGRKDKDGSVGGMKIASGPIAMSPNSSRVRIPTNTIPPPLTKVAEGDGYFSRLPRG
ncbi:hypothetical protein DHEL01_v203217 [Diaporthe helianthi]|uniref:Uncharacterized protein n=1 Tax=Diaporthe helianthi TaxID=158607 RepID=A0A2P5I7A8_DIAHE|nr:hypothetical protein DHEL01_v203217 [Diaporthe helianthi]